MKFFKDFDQNFGGQPQYPIIQMTEILQELDDYGILVKFFQDFNQNYFQELDDHRILMKFFKDFDQNSGCQPQYPTIQVTMKFFKSQMTTMVRFGYPKFGYPRVIPGPEPNFGYGLGWVCV